MTKPGKSRSAVLCWLVIIVVGIVALVFVAPIIAAVAFFTLITASTIVIGRKENGWRGFVAFAKELFFGW